MSDDSILDAQLGAVLNQTLDAVYQSKQVAWGASGSPVSAQLRELVSFLIEQSHVLMEAEESLDGRADDITAPSTHQRGNVMLEAGGDISGAISGLVSQLDAVVADVRHRAAAVGGDKDVQVLVDLADGLDARVARLR
jgi:hypothetical protein